MADVTMWWAQTSWSTRAPGLNIGFGPKGVTVSGTVTGPGGIPLGLSSAGYATDITSTFWLGPDRTVDGCAWESQAVDLTTGLVTAVTFGGVQPFGPWPRSLLTIRRTHRVFSDGNLLFEEPGLAPVVDVFEEYTTRAVSLPQSGVFPLLSSKAFDFDRTKALTIEIQVRLWIFLLGGGTVTLSGVNVNIPQFLIHSTL
jgi:hypothetical protein